MRNAYRSILGFGIIAFTLLSLQIANTKQTTVGKPPLTDNILRSKMAFAVVGEEIARGLNLHTLSESDHWKLRGPVLLEQQTDIHFLLREQYGRIVNTVYFGAALDASSPSQNLSISPENRPVLYQKAAEIIRDFIAERDISVIIRSNAPIGIGEIAAIRRLRGEVPYTYEIINSAAVSVPLKNIAALIKLPFITEIWPNSKGRLALADSIREIGADKVHKPPPNGLGVTGKGVTVAVVDNGISENTPALSKVRITKNKGGFNSGRTGAQLRHGTIMAEIIGAAQHTHNSITRTGVAPEVDFFDARITVNIGETEYGDQMDALEWAANEGADVINLSANHAPWKYSRRGDDPMSQLIDKLVVDHRVVVVNSAGNRASKRESGKIQGKGVTHTYTFNSGNVNEVAVHLVWDNKSNDLDLAIFDDRVKEICSSHQGLVDQIFDKVLPNRYGESVRCPVNPGQDYTVRVKTYNQSSFQEYEVWLDIDNISTNFGHPNREKTVGVPGYSAKVITVGAVGRNNSRTDYSSQGPSDTGLIKPEVVAPGEVWTTAGSIYWNSTGPALGTSVAAPHVSGVAALILDAVGKNSAGEWNFSPAEVKSAIVRGAENFMGNPPDNEYGAGLVRADKIIFGDEVKPHATKRFKITPALLGYKFQAGYLNAENNYSPNTIPNYVDYVAAISWEGNDSLELKLINQIRTLPERILADTTNSKDPNVQQGSNYRKIAGFSLSTNQGGLSGTLYLDVHNQGNKAIRFTGASTQPIAPAVVPILPKVGPTNPTTTAPPQGTSRLNLPEDAKMRLGKGDIHHIAYSPDGTLLATAGRVGVWLYDAETYQAVGLLRGHTHGVSTLAFSPDGKTIATGNSLVDTWANTVRLWDVDTRTEKNTLTTGLVKSIAFSRDGKTIATTDGRDEVRLWDVNTGTEKNPLTTGSVEKVAFSPDGKTIATADAGGLVRLWSVTFGVEMKVFTGYNGQVRSIAFSPDGKTIAGGGSDNTVRLWDVDTGETKHRLRGHTLEVRSIAFSPDGKTIATGSRDDTVRLWDVTTGETRHTLTGDTVQASHAEYPESNTVAFSRDGKSLASVDLDFTVRLWDVETGTEKKTFTRHTPKVYSVAFSPDGKTLASGEMDQTDKNITVRLWDVDTGTEKKTLIGHVYHVYSVAFSPDGKILATASPGNANQVRLWDVETGTEKKTLIEHPYHVYSVAFSPDGKILASGGSGDNRGSSGTVHLWDVKTGENKHTFTHRGPPTISLTFSPDGKTIAAGGIIGFGGSASLLDVETEEETHILSMEGVYSVAFSPDGKILAIGGKGYNRGSFGTVHLWNLAFDEIKHTLTAPTDPPWPSIYTPPAVNSVAFSPDGKTIATGSEDNTVHLWDVKTGESKHTLTGHTAPVRSVAFNLDGSTLASGSEDGTVLLWDVTPYTVEPPAPEYPAWDVNRDGQVNIVDVVSVSHYLGEPASASPRADVNGDGNIDILDLLLVSKHIDESTDAAAPARIAKLEGLDRTTVEGWLALARIEDDGSLMFQQGIAYLERLLEVLTPKETALLPNFPNPFNPETWIPYQLATPADVTLTIYDIQGRVVRNLNLGHQRAGMYQSKSRAAYWDGRNAVGEPVASDVYFYTLTAGDFSATRKLLIRK